MVERTEVRRPRRIRSGVALAALALAFGCGDPDARRAHAATRPTGGAARGPESDARVPSPMAPAGANATPTQSRPARVFAAQGGAGGAELEALRARLDPAHPSEAFTSEVLAELTQHTFEAGFTALLAGDPAPLVRLAGPRLVVEGELRPSALAAPGPVDAAHVLRDDAVARVVRAEGPTGAPHGLAGLEAALVALAAPLAPCSRKRARVEVTATGEEAAGEGAAERARFTATLAVRLAGDDGEGGVQQNLVLDVAWRVADGHARLVRLTPRRYEEVRLPRRAFRDATEAALRSAPRAREALGVDALALAGRFDNVVPPSLALLGMHGCAVGDVDGDGYEDLYVGRVAGSPNLLLMNGPGGVAREEGAARGVDLLDDTAGALIVDLDGDGARDLVLACGVDVVVLWNDGEGRFPGSTTLHAPEGARVYSLAAADIDSDGDVDLYDTRYFRSGGYGDQAPTPYHDAENGAANHLWRNLLEATPRSFRDDTAALGLDQNNDRFSLAAAFEDLDGDGALDLYVANDFGRNNLYARRGERFVDLAASLGLDDCAAGMGVSFADADLDGHFDLLVSNMWAPPGLRIADEARFQPSATPEVRAEYARHARGNSLFRGRAGARFEDVTEASGAAAAGWCWGARFVDFDRDGRADIVAPNGFMTGRQGPDLMGFFWRVVVGSSPTGPPASDAYLAAWATITHVAQEDLRHWNGREPTYGYLQVGDLGFVDVSAAAGFDTHEDGRALAVCDWDHDGRLDLWSKNRSAPLLRLLRGDMAPTASWVGFELRGEAPNTDAVGALVEVDAAGVTRRARVRAGDGFLAGASLRLHFGLGAAETLDAVRVRWPDGAVEAVEGVTPRATWRVSRSRTGTPGVQRLFGAEPPMAAAAVPGADEPAPQRTRVPLLDTFPLGALRLPRIGSAPERVDRLTGARGLAVLVWHAGVAESRDALARLAESRQAFAAEGLEVATLALDEARDAAAVEGLVTPLGLASCSGRADRATRLALDMVLGRTLAPFDDLPLPLVLLFDPRGELGALYPGAFAVEALLTDARALADRATGPEARWPVALAGGRWHGAPPRRALRGLAPRLREVGLPELAASFEAAADTRQDP